MSTSKLIANLLVLLFLGWLFYFGWLIDGRAFLDSDTCWLLAMGHWITEHQALPVVDPFSSGVSTFATLNPGTPLVQYQWLAEILFYAIYHWAALSGLLVLISIIACITFIWLPYLMLEKAHCHKAIIFGIIAAAGMYASFCLYVRPQIFSYLFLALLVYLYIPSCDKLKRIALSGAIATLAIMLLWANMHIFFPLGIIFISMILLGRFAEVKIIDRGSDFPLSQFIMPVLAVIPTTINPWGVGIWAYVERIRNNTNSDWITELQPVQIFNWHDPLAQYLWLLLIVYVLLVIYFRAFTLTKLGLVSPLFAACGLYMSLQHCKLMPITSLFILIACIELISRQSNTKLAVDNLVSGSASVLVSSSTSNLKISWNKIDDYLTKELTNKPVWLSIMLITVLLGTVFASIYYPVTLPQTSESFKVPFKAIDYLKTHRPAGKLFNDPRFGSVMIWYLNNPNVFYDTRFSQYEPQRMLESIRMEDCEYGWKDIWKKYNFDWVFIRASRPLVKALHKMGWKTAYEDKTAVILTKR